MTAAELHDLLADIDKLTKKHHKDLSALIILTTGSNNEALPHAIGINGNPHHIVHALTDAMVQQTEIKHIVRGAMAHYVAHKEHENNNN